MNTIPLVARVLLALIFVVSGVSKVQSWEATLAMVQSTGLPAPALGLALATAVELVCGVLLALGWQGRAVALVLALYLIPTTLVFHNFWSVPPDQSTMQAVQFLKNMAIIGGLLQVVVWGVGPLSIDSRHGATRRPIDQAWPESGGSTPSPA